MASNLDLLNDLVKERDAERERADAADERARRLEGDLRKRSSDEGAVSALKDDLKAARKGAKDARQRSATLERERDIVHDALRREQEKRQSSEKAAQSQIGSLQERIADLENELRNVTEERNSSRRLVKTLESENERLSKVERAARAHLDAQGVLHRAIGR